MKSNIKFVDSKTQEISHCGDHFDISVSSMPLKWQGILLEKGSCDYFHPRHVITEDFYFAMLVQTNLKWQVEIDGMQTDIYSPSETVWMNPPYTPFSNSANGEVQFINLLISKEMLFKHYEGFLPKRPLTFLHDYNVQDPIMSHLIYLFYEEVKNKGMNGLKFQEQLLTMLATYYIDNYSNLAEVINRSENEGTDYITQEKLQMLDAYIEEKIDTIITIEDLAKVLEMTKYQLLRTFKKEKGITPYQYLIVYRINKAKYILRNSEDSFTEIAIALGFSDSSHFTRTFKKYTGYTPTQFRYEM